MSYEKAKADPEQYTFPVFGTTIGGLARRLGSKYFFLEPPSNGEGKEGDEVPGCIELFPANELAANIER
ncbi:hypothetical protein K2Q08_02615 [Patescibacteria group bacterium]|nr:hypothetical protein [Patescibacteria group bacterium]